MANPGKPGLASPRTPAAQRPRFESCSSRRPSRSGSAAGRRHTTWPADARELFITLNRMICAACRSKVTIDFNELCGLYPAGKSRLPVGVLHHRICRGKSAGTSVWQHAFAGPTGLQVESSSSRPESGISVLPIRALTARPAAKGSPTHSFDH